MKTYLLHLGMGALIGALGVACGASTSDSLNGGGDLTGTNGANSGASSGSGSASGSSSAALDIGAPSDGGMYNPDQPWYGDASAESSADPTAPANTPVQLAAGQKHTCARMQDGTVRCWGEDLKGQLGGSSRVAPVAGLTGVVSIGAGLAHTCALTADGAAYCWGTNALNQLGDGLGGASGTEQTSEVPVAVKLTPGKKALRLFVNADTSCVQFDDHTIQCWGTESYSGDASTIGPQFNAALSATSGTDGEIVSIAMVQYNRSTFALLLRDGRVISAEQTQTSPPVVMTFAQKDPTDPVVSLHGGSDLLAVTASGKLYAVARYNSLLMAKYLTNNACPIAQVRPARSACFCANQADGCLDGNCARGGGANDCSYMVNVPDNTGSTAERNEVWTPDLWVPFETSACAQVSTFARAMVNLTNDPTESSSGGPPAVPATYDDSSEAPCIAQMMQNVLDIGTCDMPGDGNATGCTFNPIFSDADDPVFADHTAKFVDAANTMVTSGSTGFACALKSDGHVYCWGHNNVGQLGQGNVYDAQGDYFARPAINLLPVHGPEGIVELTVGASHSCARSSSNQVYCWGENAPAFPSSRVGNASAANGAAPLEPISFVPDIAFVPTDAGDGG